MLVQLEKHYGEDHTRPSYSPVQAPAWLTKKKNPCHQIKPEEWEAKGLQPKLRSEALLTLKGPTAVRPLLESISGVSVSDEIFCRTGSIGRKRKIRSGQDTYCRCSLSLASSEGIDLTLLIYFQRSSGSAASLSHRAPMGYRQTAIYYGRRRG